MSSRVIETDSRGRISLKKLGVDSHSHYQVTVLPSGNVLLEPVVFETALKATLDNTLPDINNIIIENQDAGYPISTSSHSTLEALLAFDHNGSPGTIAPPAPHFGGCRSS